MDWGSSFLMFACLYFFGSIFLSIIFDPATWEPADISKPDIGYRGAENNSFNWAMMMNRDE